MTSHLRLEPGFPENTPCAPRADAKEGFFASLVDTVVQSFGGFYPELRAARDTIYDVIRDEEASFSRTLLKGIEKYKKAAAVAKEGKQCLRSLARDWHPQWQCCTNACSSQDQTPEVKDVVSACVSR